MAFVAEMVQVELGAFEFQSNPWNKGELVFGTDFSQSLRRSPLSDALRLDWTWPADGSEIMAYPGVILGMKPWSTTSTTPLFPIRIDAIETLSIDFDLDWDDARSNFNVSFDLWIASATEDGDGVVVSEVMVWVKMWDWTPSEVSLSRYTDANGTADVYSRPDHQVGDDGWNYTAFVFNEDVRRGTIDVVALLEEMTGLGLLKPAQYLMDIELGAEVVSGSGWLDIAQFGVSLNGVTESLVSDTVLGAVDAGQGLRR